MTLRLLTMTGSTLLLLLGATMTCQSQALLTESQAMAAVRTFEDDQNIQLSSSALREEQDDRSATGVSHSYTLNKVATPDPRWTWDVDAVSGEVTYVRYGNRIPTSGSSTPYGTYTQAQCRQVALDFARAKYSAFDNQGFQLMADSWEDTGWGFGWRQVIAYGAVSPNLVNINVSSTTGLIQTYNGTRYPSFSPQQTPTVISQQAIQLAAQELGIVSGLINDTPELNATKSTLFWRVHVSGEDADSNYFRFVTVDLDAYTGATLDIQSSGGAIPIRARKTASTKPNLKPAKASLSGKGSKATAKTKLTIQAKPGGKKPAACAKPTKAKTNPKTSKPQLTKPK